MEVSYEASSLLDDYSRHRDEHDDCGVRQECVRAPVRIADDERAHL